MPQKLFRALVSAAALATVGVQAAAHPSAEHNALVDQTPGTPLPSAWHHKPGAAIGFSHSGLETVSAQESGRVTVTLSEAYESGVMTVSVRGSDGLEVFGAERIMQFDLASGAPHQVSINYRAEHDGDYRIGVVATVELEGGFRMGRAYAVPVRIGKGGNTSVASKGSVQTDVTGERRIVFQAVETIR